MKKFILWTLFLLVLAISGLVYLNTQANKVVVENEGPG